MQSSPCLCFTLTSLPRQIWISPITKGLEGNWSVGENYHGFWQQDPTQLNSYFGTEDDLKSLSKALHDRGMVRKPALLETRSPG